MRELLVTYWMGLWRFVLGVGFIIGVMWCLLFLFVVGWYPQAVAFVSLTLTLAAIPLLIGILVRGLR